MSLSKDIQPKVEPIEYARPLRRSAEETLSVVEDRLRYSLALIFGENEENIQSLSDNTKKPEALQAIQDELKQSVVDILFEARKHILSSERSYTYEEIPEIVKTLLITVHLRLKASLNRLLEDPEHSFTWSTRRRLHAMLGKLDR